MSQISKLTIRLGHGTESICASLTNGPGWRIPIWVQGCSVRCTSDCLNPRLLSPLGGVPICIGRLVERFLSIRAADPRVEGVTVLGGEPFDQAEPLSDLLEAAKELGFSTMVYTGHIYEDLRTRQSALRAVQSIDILVDGAFVAALFGENLAWRGSANQRLICLTSRYDSELLEHRYAAQGKAFSVRVSGHGLVSVSGLQVRKGAALIEGEVLRTKQTTPSPRPVTGARRQDFDTRQSFRQEVDTPLKKSPL